MESDESSSFPDEKHECFYVHVTFISNLGFSLLNCMLRTLNWMWMMLLVKGALLL